MRRRIPVLLLLLTVGLLATTVGAQSRRKKGEKQTPQKLEMRAQKAEQELAREYLEVAGGYYDLGDVEKAKDFLIRLNDLREGLPGVSEKIKELEEELMQSNSDEITIDVSKGWGDAIAEVKEGDAFRISATGDYKLTVMMSLDVNGAESKDPIRDMARNVPFGGLMGIIQRQDGKPSKPFPILAGGEITPRADGLLYVRVNTPMDAKCVGKLKVKISGRVVTRASSKSKSKKRK